jgi:hypothetical protein
MFSAIEDEHQRVHAIACLVLRDAIGGTPIVPVEAAFRPCR